MLTQFFSKNYLILSKYIFLFSCNVTNNRVSIAIFLHQRYSTEMLSLQNAKSNLSKERRRKKFTTSRTKPKFPDDTFDHNSFKREMHGVFHNLRGVAITVRKK